MREKWKNRGEKTTTLNRLLSLLIGRFLRERLGTFFLVLFLTLFSLRSLSHFSSFYRYFCTGCHSRPFSQFFEVHATPKSTLHLDESGFSTMDNGQCQNFLLFDIDGTLISSGNAGTKALNRACWAVHQIANAAERIRLDGKTDRAIVREILEHSPEKSAGKNIEQLIDQTLEQYLEFLPEEVEQSLTYQVLPGIKKILDIAEDHKDFVLGLATGNLKSGAKIKLNRADLNPYFSFGGFGCDSEDRPEVVKTAFFRGQEYSGEKILEENTYVIGDTHHDITAGKSLGVKTIAVTTGSYPKDHLANYKPNFLFNDLSDVKKFFEIFSE